MKHLVEFDSQEMDVLGQYEFKRFETDRDDYS